MVLFSPPNITNGIDDLAVTTAQSVPVFPIMILFFIFFVIFLSGSANEKRRIGSADYPFWGVLSSLATMFVALLFTLGAGLINIETLGIVMAITTLFGVWFFISKVKGEI